VSADSGGPRDAWMRCADGTRLVSRIWSPAGAGPWPVLLMRQPYGRAIASTVTYAHPTWYADRGFLVVVQDVRGCGDSEGTFAGFAQEAADGAETVRWARSLPGSNGRLACYGFSYQGLTQLLLADATDLPDCLVPAMCGLDERLHWASEGGAHWWALGLAWALQLAAQRCRRAGDHQAWSRIRRRLDDGSFLWAGEALLERHDPDGMGLRWLSLDPADPAGWGQHRPAAALLRRPMLLVGGWHDPHLTGVLDLWSRSRRAGGRPGLRIGAWSHLRWGGGLDAVQLEFLHRGLAGQPPTGDPPLEWQCPITAVWRRDDPHHCPEPLNWSLSSDGLAAVRTDGGTLASGPGGGRLVIVHDPWRPVPGRGGHLGLDAGVVDRADLDARTDVACFTSAAFSGSAWLLGRPLLLVEVGADQPGFDLCACLSLLREGDGRVRQVSTGVARWRGEPCLTPSLRRLALQPLGLVLKAGDRLRLSLAAAAWPQIAVNPGDGSLARGPAGVDHRCISLSLNLAGSRFWLEPLVAAD
jgi:putative CocE/NonD family hydrolase